MNPIIIGLVAAVAVFALVVVALLPYFRRGVEWHDYEGGMYHEADGFKLLVMPADGTWGVCMYKYEGLWAVEIVPDEGDRRRLGSEFATPKLAMAAALTDTGL